MRPRKHSDVTPEGQDLSDSAYSANPHVDRVGRIGKVDHIAIAVRDSAQALRLYTEVLGYRAQPTAEVASEATRVTIVEAGETRIELVEPTQPDSAVGKYLERRGEGIHHVCLEVPSLEAAVARLQAEGYELANATPRLGHGGRRFIFIHPRAANGVLVELYEAGGVSGE
jgi:methylmalonyl-CoA epimerase